MQSVWLNFNEKSPFNGIGLCLDMKPMINVIDLGSQILVNYDRACFNVTWKASSTLFVYWQSMKDP